MSRPIPQLQERLITRYGADGRQVLSTQLQRLALQNGEYLTPRSVNWNIEFDREWIKNLIVRVGYQQRQGTREYILDPIDSVQFRQHLVAQQRRQIALPRV